MARKSPENRHTRKLGKTGNADSPSFFVTLPIDIVRSLKWDDGRKVTIKKSRNKIVIENWQE